MRKLLSLLLCLTLFLPVMAMAEAKEILEMYPIDFGDFIMTLYEGDYYEVAPEKIDSEVYAKIFPAYDESDVPHDNFSVVWMKDDLSELFTMLGGAETYANMVLESAKQQYESRGIKVSDAEVLAAKYEDGLGAFLTFANLSFTSDGVDITTPLYQLQAYFCRGEAGSYIFTFTTYTYEDMNTLTSYLDTLEFK